MLLKGANNVDNVIAFLASETSYVNVFLSFFVVVNSIFSVFAGLAISTKRKSNEDSNSVKQVSINPGINLGTV